MSTVKANTVKTTTIQHTNGITAATIDSFGAFSTQTTTTGELGVNGTLSLNVNKKITNSNGVPLLSGAGGHIINVYSKIDTEQAVITNSGSSVGGITNTAVGPNADYNIPGLALTITPTHTFSQFIITSTVTFTTNYVVGFGIKRNGTKIGKATNLIRAEMGTGLSNIWFIGHENNNYIMQEPIIEVDQPGTLSPITYQVFVRNTWANTTNTWYYNQRANRDMGQQSTLVIYEVVRIFNV